MVRVFLAILFVLFSATAQAQLLTTTPVDAGGDTTADSTANAQKSLIVDQSGTAITFVDAITFDFDSGGGTQTGEAIGIMCPASGGAVLCSQGDASNGILVNLGANNDVTIGVNLATEDLAETADSANLFRMGAVRRDAAASSSGTTGDNSTINVDALGLLWSRFLDPCSGVAKVSVPIDIVTATTTELINGSGASNKAYICSINLVTASANNVALVEDDTDNCGSPSAGMAGGVTAGEGWNFAANGGLTLGSGLGTVAQTSVVNRFVCLITSAGTQLSGTVVYALAP